GVQYLQTAVVSARERMFQSRDSGRLRIIASARSASAQKEFMKETAYPKGHSTSPNWRGRNETPDPNKCGSRATAAARGCRMTSPIEKLSVLASTAISDFSLSLLPADYCQRELSFDVQPTRTELVGKFDNWFGDKALGLKETAADVI